MIYLHPYDYLFNKEFWVDFKHFSELKGLNKYLKWFRQNQWLGLGNKSTFNKLQYLTDYFFHLGPINEGLSKGKNQSSFDI